jgi:hypothetical protein
MKTVDVTCTWRSTTRVEVPDGYEFDGGLDPAWADQVDPSTAELVDWTIDGR